MGTRLPLKAILLCAAVLALAATAAGCGRDSNTADAAPAASGTTSDLSGSVSVDGSSTVGPLTTAAAERFKEQSPNVNVTVGISGTGGGFEKFCNGETDLSDASREIKDEEATACKGKSIDYVSFRVATDALTVVVNKDNDWIDCITTDQLKAIWGPDSKIDNWKDVPGGDYPDQKLTLTGPGTDSGTCDYFTAAINGEEDASRTDYNATEDDNVTVTAVSGDKGGMGYFGYSYYEQNQDKLKALAIDSGSGCVDPSVETAQDGTYAPLSRPLFVYVNKEALARPEVAAFLTYYIDNLEQIAKDAQFVPLTDDQAAESKTALEGATTR